jgi:nucleotide-binding universal stress UspA family protein
MKLLIAYDGSRCSDAALDDLVRAGISDDCEALVVSVADVWLPPPTANGKGNGNVVQPDPDVHLGARYERVVREHYEKNRSLVAEAQTLANHAKQRLERMFPKWRVTAKATYGSPAWELLAQADEFGADLIVVGSHGHSALSRFVLGSISQKVLTEARCSVRVSRGKIEVDPVPTRIVIAFDGSKGAQVAVDAISKRPWREFSEVRIVTALDNVAPSAIGRFISPVRQAVQEVNDLEREWVEELADAAADKLQSAGFTAALHLLPGNAKEVIVAEAERWGADCIFVGANAFGTKLERFLLGSTSAAIAARAHCSVEVVRK